MTPRERAVEAFDRWYQSLPRHTASGGPALGRIAAALVVLERLRTNFDLTLNAHRAKGGSQIKGVSGASVKGILQRFGEHRQFLSEGGRTNRGAPGDIDRMLQYLAGAGLDSSDAETRTDSLTAAQQYLVERIREWHGKKRLGFAFDPARSTWQIVRQILDEAQAVGKEGPVAQYLVGAKLQLRYARITVENFSYSTSDTQRGRSGDFQVGDTAFHVTVSPMPGVYERCRRNLQDGLRVYLIVPDRVLAGARQNADIIQPGRIFVASLEDFVGGNLDEMSGFRRRDVLDKLRELLDVYNERVNAVEMDKSMMIQIPVSLAR